jgi:hypothetical protein
LEPDRSGGFEGGEQAHSNGAEAKKENVETTRSNELAEVVGNFKPETIGRWASAQGQPAKLLLDGEEFDEFAENPIAQLV